MPVIRISQSTWERLQAYAVPLEDTAETALRKVLDAADKATGKVPAPVAVPTPKPILAGSVGRRPKQGRDKLAQKEFRAPLMRTLADLGGRAEVAAIREAMLPKVQSRLLEGDLEEVSTGEERWWNATCWERADMVRDGTLEKDLPRGIWGLTEQAKRNLKMTWNVDFKAHTATTDVGVATFYVDDEGRYVSLANMRFTVTDPGVSMDTFGALASEAIQNAQAKRG